MTTRLLLVDDHKVVRSGLRMLLDNEADLTIVGEAGTGQEALQLVEQLQPDLVLMDIMLDGDVDGIEKLRRFIDHHLKSTVQQSQGRYPTRLQTGELLRFALGGEMHFLLSQGLRQQLDRVAQFARVADVGLGDSRNPLGIDLREEETAREDQQHQQ